MEAHLSIILATAHAQVLVMGSAVGVIDSFLFMYLEDLGASETLMGLTLTFTCIGMSTVLPLLLRMQFGRQFAIHLDHQYMQ